MFSDNNVFLEYLHTGITQLGRLAGYVVQVAIYYNYFLSLETAPANIMLPYYFLSYGLCIESQGRQVQSANEHHSDIRKITCVLCVGNCKEINI